MQITKIIIFSTCAQSNSFYIIDSYRYVLKLFSNANRRHIIQYCHQADNSVKKKKKKKRSIVTFFKLTDPVFVYICARTDNLQGNFCSTQMSLVEQYNKILLIVSIKKFSSILSHTHIFLFFIYTLPTKALSWEHFDSSLHLLL